MRYTNGQAVVGHSRAQILRTLRTHFKIVLANPESRKIFYFLMLNMSYMLIQMLYGMWTNSLGLISDAIHMAFDCMAISIGLFASIMATWAPNERFTYGYGRIETLSGFANGIFLILISIFIVFEAVQRLLEPPEMDTSQLLLVSVMGLAINLFGMFAMGGHHHHHGHGHAHGPVKACHEYPDSHGKQHSNGLASNNSCNVGSLAPSQSDHHPEKHSDYTPDVVSIHGEASHYIGEVRQQNSGMQQDTRTIDRMHRHDISQDANGTTPHSSNPGDVPSPITPSYNFGYDAHFHTHHHSDCAPNLHDHSHVHPSIGHSHNMRGVFLHVMADTLGSIGVIISTLLIQLYGWTGFDPIASLFIAVLIATSVVPLVLDTGKILALDVGERGREIQQALAELSSVEGLLSHGAVRFWPKDSSSLIGSIHIHLAPPELELSLVRDTSFDVRKRRRLDNVVRRVDTHFRDHIAGLEEFTIQVQVA